MSQVPALSDTELLALIECIAQVAQGQHVRELELVVEELRELRRQLSTLPARTNLLMMSAAIASELAGTYDSIKDPKTQAHIALLSVQLALKLEELVPR